MNEIQGRLYAPSVPAQDSHARMDVVDSMKKRKHLKGSSPLCISSFLRMITMHARVWIGIINPGACTNDHEKKGAPQKSPCMPRDPTLMQGEVRAEI